MQTQRTALILCAASLLLGCSQTMDGTPAGTRAVTGQLVATGYALDNPVVVAEAADHRVFVTHLSANGFFLLALPPNVQYRLTLANSTRSGAYSAVAHINWPLASGAARWATLGEGETLQLGHVYRRGTQTTQKAGWCSGCGDASDDPDGGAGGGGGYKHDCKQDDNAKTTTTGTEGDCDCDHKHQTSDHCDGDANGPEHDKDCDDHEKGKEGCMMSGSGSVGTQHYSGGGDDGDDDGHGEHGDGGVDGEHHGGGYVCVDAGVPSKPPTTTPPPPSGTGSAGDTCVVNADCGAGLSCVTSVCTVVTPTQM